MRRLLVFGAQHPDLAQMFRSRWRSSSRYRERATESLAELGAGSREAVLRWLDVGPDLPPPSLLQPLSTLAQCLAAAQLSASGLRWDGAIGVSMG